MQNFELNRCFKHLAKYSSIELEELSEKARLKFQVMDLLRRSGSVNLTVEHYRISRATLYRWKNQYNPKNPYTLEELSKRPHRYRKHDAKEAVNLILEKTDLFKKDDYGKLKEVQVTSFQAYETSAVNYKMIFLLEFLFEEGISLDNKVAILKEFQEFFDKV